MTKPFPSHHNTETIFSLGGLPLGIRVDFLRTSFVSSEVVRLHASGVNVQSARHLFSQEWHEVDVLDASMATITVFLLVIVSPTHAKRPRRPKVRESIRFALAGVIVLLHEFDLITTKETLVEEDGVCGEHELGMTYVHAIMMERVRHAHDRHGIDRCIKFVQL